MKKIIATAFVLLILTSMVIVINQDISTSALTAEPAKLKLYISPTRLQADGFSHQCIFVQLLDSSGKPARATSYTYISLSSSKESVGTVDSEIMLSPGETYGNASFTCTQTPGSTTITATATDFGTVSASLTTTAPGLIPTKLAVFCTPSLLPADGGTYESVLVQLQDAQSRPTINNGSNIYVNMFSSETTVGNISPLLTINPGESQVLGNFEVTNSPGSTTITAQASNFVTAQAKLTTYTIDLSVLKVQLTPTAQSLLNGNNTVITASVTADGAPVAGATVRFTSDNGGRFSTVKDVTGGTYTTTFTAPSFSKVTNCTITATATKTGYWSGQVTTQIAVGPSIISNTVGTLQFRVKADSGDVLTGTVISSTNQPDGVTPLYGVTNSTGYVTFSNLPAGSYSFLVFKDGYQGMNETINFKAETLSLTLTLSPNTVLSSTTTFYVIIIVITAAVVSIVAGLLIIRRRRSKKIRKLQDLQKHLKYKQ